MLGLKKFTPNTYKLKVVSNLKWDLYNRKHWIIPSLSIINTGTLSFLIAFFSPHILTIYHSSSTLHTKDALHKCFLVTCRKVKNSYCNHSAWKLIHCLKSALLCSAMGKQASQLGVKTHWAALQEGTQCDSYQRFSFPPLTFLQNI